MDTKVLVTSELRQHCVRNGSDTHLEACSIIDERCTMLSYGDFHIVRLAEMSRFQRFVSFDEDVNHIHRNHCVSPCTRNIRIYYRDNCLCAFYCCKCRVNGSSERDVSVLVRRTYLDHGNVATQGSASVQFLSFAEEYRNIVRISGLYALADVATDKECLVEEYSAEFRICVWSRSFGVEVMDPDILKLTGFASRTKCIYKHSWSACNTAQMNVVA